MNLKALHFLNSNILSVETIENEETMQAIATPNPMITQTTIHFTASGTNTAKLSLYTSAGKLVKQINLKTVNGSNKIKLNRGDLSSGLYFVKLESNFESFKPSKLIIN